MRFLVLLVLLPGLALARGGSIPASSSGSGGTLDAGWSAQDLRAYGAACNGATDDSAAYQAMADALPSGGGTLRIPDDKTCVTAMPIFLTKSHTRVMGGGWGSVIKGSGNRPVLIFEPASWPTVPTQAAMISSDPSLDFPDNSAYINLSELPSTAMPIDGQAAFDVGAYWWPYSAGRGGPNYLIQSHGKRYGGDTAVNAFFIREDGSGGVTCGITTTTGVHTALGGASMTMDQANVVELEYDGAHLGCAVNGTFGSFTAATGTMSQRAWEQVVIGNGFDQYGPSVNANNGPRGRVANLVIAKAAAHTANYTASGYQFVFNANGLLSFRTDLITHNVVGVTTFGGGVSYLTEVYMDFGAEITGCEVADVQFSGGGRPIQIFGCDNSNVRDIFMVGPTEDGISLDQLSYGSKLHTIMAVGAGHTIVHIMNSGIVSLTDFHFVGSTVAPIFSSGAGIQFLNDGYVVPAVGNNTTLYDVWVNGSGNNNIHFAAKGLDLSSESGAVEASMCLENLASGVITGTSLESTQNLPDGGSPPAFVRLDNTAGSFPTGFPVRMTAGQFYASAPSKLFELIGTWSKPGNIVLEGVQTDTTSVTTLANVDGQVVVDPHNKSNNRPNTCTVTNTATTCIWTFGATEPDTSYYAIAVSSAVSGSPATNSAIVLSQTKATGSVTFNLAAAPGAGTSRTFDVVLVR